MDRRAFVGLLGITALHRPLNPARRAPRWIERWSWAMGQTVHIQLYAESESMGLECAAEALAELRRVEGRLSVFDDASDLSELNRQAGRRPVRVSDDLVAVLTAAERARTGTDGAFNVAVEPLMRAWGFRAERPAEPGAGELAEAREAVRTAVVMIDGGRVALPNAHTRLDLGGIGVGYGLDRMAAVLRRRGIAQALLDVSGDMMAIGAPPGEQGWRVAIAGSAGGVGTDERVLRDAALATSANTVQVRHYGSLTVGHVMDPGTGTSARGREQATVVAASAIRADVLSTAALVRR